jgi:hypothetical protein
MQLKLTVHGGKVACPERGPTDVGRCVACRHFEATETAGDGQVVVCNPARFVGGSITIPGLLAR